MVWWWNDVILTFEKIYKIEEEFIKEVKKWTFERLKMVFESMVVDILNKILGDFVVNLDTKQLKIGIWGGELFSTFLFNMEKTENIERTGWDYHNWKYQCLKGRSLVKLESWDSCYLFCLHAFRESCYLDLNNLSIDLDELLWLVT